MRPFLCAVQPSKTAGKIHLGKRVIVCVVPRDESSVSPLRRALTRILHNYIRKSLLNHKRRRRMISFGVSVCRKSLAEFAPAGANKVLTIFSGDMCVGENTSRLANVRVVRHRRTASALRRAAAFSNESPTKWVSFESLSKILF